MYLVNTGFSGIISGHKGQVIEIKDKKIAEDLMSAGYIQPYSEKDRSVSEIKKDNENLVKDNENLTKENEALKLELETLKSELLKDTSEADGKETAGGEEPTADNQSSDNFNEDLNANLGEVDPTVKTDKKSVKA